MSITSFDDDSSIEDPIHFFYFFFEKNGLEVLSKDFMPDPTDDKNWMYFLSPSISHIDFDNNRYTLIHRVEEEGHGDDELGIWIIDKTSYKEKTYVFEEFLNDTFKNEYLKSREYISKVLKDVPTIEKGIHLCNLWIDSLFYYIQNCNEEPYKYYKECARPLEATIRFLLDKYPSYCPPLNSKKELVAIKNKVWGSEIQSEKQLMPTICNTLADLYDNDDEYLIFYEDYSSKSERGKIVKSLNDLLQGFSHKIPVINFQWEKDPVYYILTLLMKHNKRMVLKEVQNIFIKSKPFVAGNCYRGANRFINNPKKIELKNKIDNLFREHIK